MSEKDKILTTNEGIKVVADLNIEDINVNDIDIFIICGGNTENIKFIDKLHSIIAECKKKNKIIGGICAGKEIIINALNLQDVPDKTTVMERVVLSPGYEYVDFALEVGRIAEVYVDEDDYLETVNFFKFYQSADNP